MLKKMYRGLTSQDISELFDKKTARSLSNSFFRVNWMKSASPFPKFAVIVTPNIHKSAVRRNSLRRAIYEIIRLNFKDWTQGLRVAILVKKSALDCPYGILQEKLLSLLLTLH